jgi:hypothetical protein
MSARRQRKSGWPIRHPTSAIVRFDCSFRFVKPVRGVAQEDEPHDGHEIFVRREPRIGAQVVGDLPEFRLYEAETMAEIKTKVPSGNQVWNRIVQNRDDRYHYLEEVRREFDLVTEGIEQALDLRLLKKSMIADGDGEE